MWPAALYIMVNLVLDGKGASNALSRQHIDLNLYTFSEIIRKNLILGYSDRLSESKRNDVSLFGHKCKF